ncbi:MAG TPA: circularly permuted type 2 ATP-grasp protein [Candidatus Methylomirabilis sp.]|nr:circularly permuted type 2 ATP-grasp protein [Candidatus Methylomirabilis sp.]
MNWPGVPSGYDEVFEEAGRPRPHYAHLLSILESFTAEDVERRERLQRLALMNQGITFTVYGEEEGLERIFPFDFVPRIIPAAEWKTIQDGLIQRIHTLNLFLQDVYHEQRCLKERIIPAELVLSRREFKRELLGLAPPRKIFTHVVGTDLIRSETGAYLVLEDNCRVPSGVSYVLENRSLLNRVFPEFFASYPVRPIKEYPTLLLDTLLFVAPRPSQSPVVVVLSPGIHNSAYFEHSFLAREMGVALVEGRDLLVEGNHVFMRRTHGKQQIDVIYRRIDDDFLDPLTFQRNSLLGVPGLINVYREGNVALANAPGAGVADDKAVYAFMPELIRYYLGEAPLLDQVPTYVGLRPGDFRYMTEHLDQLVVKTTGDAGGYGMLMGPFASAEERTSYLEKMKANPGNYIAQPLVHFSSHPTRVDGRFEPRRIDLRPFILYGDRIRVLPGGLTRVALRRGSFVVNSSQGGGSKDTWVLAPREP